MAKQIEDCCVLLAMSTVLGPVFRHEIRIIQQSAIDEHLQGNDRPKHQVKESVERVLLLASLPLCPVPVPHSKAD